MNSLRFPISTSLPSIRLDSAYLASSRPAFSNFVSRSSKKSPLLAFSAMTSSNFLSISFVRSCSTWNCAIYPWYISIDGTTLLWSSFKSSYKQYLSSPDLNFSSSDLKAFALVSSYRFSIESLLASIDSVCLSNKAL
jgi:hypothetical protein